MSKGGKLQNRARYAPRALGSNWFKNEELGNRLGRRARAAKGEIVEGNATAAGMNRLLDSDNVKDTVKNNAGE